MKYLLMIYADEAIDQKMSHEEMGAIFGEYHQFTEEITAAGAYIGGEPLEPVASSTTVRVRESRTLTTDGPFAETKEQLGGYYLIDVPNLDDAIRWAAKIPHARLGCVEVRPIMAMPS
ncbi:MAG: YciI family protein [Bryobacterales bacterium]|nr:YciI family protein [Bryobacterales bacterium]